MYWTYEAHAISIPFEYIYLPYLQSFQIVFVCRRMLSVLRLNFGKIRCWNYIVM